MRCAYIVRLVVPVLVCATCVLKGRIRGCPIRIWIEVERGFNAFGQSFQYIAILPPCGGMLHSQIHLSTFPVFLWFMYANNNMTQGDVELWRCSAAVAISHYVRGGGTEHISTKPVNRVHYAATRWKFPPQIDCLEIVSVEFIVHQGHSWNLGDVIHFQLHVLVAPMVIVWVVLPVTCLVAQSPVLNPIFTQLRNLVEVYDIVHEVKGN